MTPDLYPWLSVVALGAAVLVVHAWTLWSAASGEIGLRRRPAWLFAAVVLPPVAPWLAWRARAHAAALAWPVVVALYVAVRVSS
ncbi:MAG: hypothetical protein KC543_12490 [Myxococcales bacterium]|nr:hypothetical protein [Myxococcales bacterium]